MWVSLVHQSHGIFSAHVLTVEHSLLSFTFLIQSQYTAFIFCYVYVCMYACLCMCECVHAHMCILAIVLRSLCKH